MSQISALADEDVRRALKAVGAEVQASLALNRAVLQALAGLSPTLAAVAERALDDELDLARERGAPQHMLELLEDARERLQDNGDDVEMIGALEHALVAAADALPDIRDLHEA